MLTFSLLMDLKNTRIPQIKELEVCQQLYQSDILYSFLKYGCCNTVWKLPLYQGSSRMK